MVELEDLTLWTAVEGVGDPLVLCHGGPGLWDDLGPVSSLINDLVKVHRYDQRGGGRSTDGTSHTVTAMVQDLESLRQHWGYEQWSVGGHSWGASLALAYAAAHPCRVDKLLYISGTGLGWSWHSDYRTEVEKRLGPDGRSELAALKLERDRHGSDTAAFAEVDRAICRMQWSTDFSDADAAARLVDTLLDHRFVPSYELNRTLTSDWKKLAATDGFRDSLANFQSPVLVVHGLQDPRPVSAISGLADSLSNCRVEHIDKAGHFPWLEQPDDFKAIVRPFLAT